MRNWKVGQIHTLTRRYRAVYHLGMITLDVKKECRQSTTLS